MNKIYLNKLLTDKPVPRVLFYIKENAMLFGEFLKQLEDANGTDPIVAEIINYLGPSHERDMVLFKIYGAFSD